MITQKAKNGLSMRRALLIARRDYLGYIKTWGFWISFVLPFVFGILMVLATRLDINLEPTRYETIVDDTGLYKAGLIAQYETDYTARARSQILQIADVAMSDEDVADLTEVIDTRGIDAAVSHLNLISPGLGDSLKLPKKTLVFIDPPTSDVEVLKTYMISEKPIEYNGESVALNGILHIQKNEPLIESGIAAPAANEGGETEDAPYVNVAVNADYWSTQVTANAVQSLANNYFKNISQAAFLESGGLTSQGLEDSQRNALRLESFDPTKAVGETGEGQKVTSKDRLPYIVAGIMAMVLWLAVFSGAYMLLTSMLEEKLNKLLEMMLASTNFGEIILGKLIGVAALTLTAMLPYIIIGGGGVVAIILFGPAEVSDPIRQAFTWKMMVFFPLFLVLGYIFYGCLFIAMGALAESMQDAQTITTPIVMVLTLCVLIVPLGWNSPDSPLLIFASWFPLSAPFAAISRLPSDPPAWELFLSAGFLALLSVGVIILASRVFRYGVLSGAGIKGISLWFKRTVLRRKNV